MDEYGLILACSHCGYIDEQYDVPGEDIEDLEDDSGLEDAT